jgi:hypothetical protein
MFLSPSGPVDLKRDAKWILCVKESRLPCALKTIKIVAFFCYHLFKTSKGIKAGRYVHTVINLGNTMIDGSRG